MKTRIGTLILMAILPLLNWIPTAGGVVPTVFTSDGERAFGCAPVAGGYRNLPDFEFPLFHDPEGESFVSRRNFWCDGSCAAFFAGELQLPTLPGGSFAPEVRPEIPSGTAIVHRGRAPPAIL